MDHQQRIEAHKAEVRKNVWIELRKVAMPDSRFHYDFSSFIADFKGSIHAIERITHLEVYKTAKYVFITPDNCLQDLRYRALRDKKHVIVTTYAIRRGFVVLDPFELESQHCNLEYASTLDGMERVGNLVSLHYLRNRLSQKIMLMVTGAGALNMLGIRYGKGHGFFDLEWGMLYSIGCIDLNTPVITVAHDCQVIEDDGVRVDVFDTVSDYIATPTRLIEVKNAMKPAAGILWNRLQDGMLESIPPLQELKDWQLRKAKANSTDLRDDP